MKLNVGGWMLSAAAAATLATAGSVQAQPVSTPLAEPLTVSGSAGGGGAQVCGQLPAMPSQVLTVTEPFASFDIQVRGEGEITLYIEGPNEFSQCQRSGSLEPGLIQAPGPLNQGTYNIFVGSQTAAQPPYSLTIQQR